MSCDSAKWGTDARRLVELDEAWSIVAGDVRALPSETVSLADADGRVLAKPVHAKTDWPPFDKAMMDGFAVRAADCAPAGTELSVVGEVTAGDGTHVAIEAGQAIRINTGAPMPKGADAVAPIEICTIDDSGDRVTIATVLRAGQHVALRGTDRHAGDLLLASPMTIEAAQIGALATAGLGAIRVFPGIDVSIVVTGNEIVPVGEPCRPGQIYDSNGPMLASLMRQFGASPRNWGIARDNPDELRSKLQAALASPVVVTVGGMSMGTLDLVPKTFVDLGVSWRFHGVRMRPGKPVAYGRGPDGQHVFGLPGNPVSAFVCAWLFVRMVIRGLAGHTVAPPHRWRATLMRAIEPKRDGRPAFVPARIWHHADAGLIAEPCAWGGSGDPFGLATANALLVLEDPTRGGRANESVEVISISGEIS